MGPVVVVLQFPSGHLAVAVSIHIGKPGIKIEVATRFIASNDAIGVAIQFVKQSGGGRRRARCSLSCRLRMPLRSILQEG
jgi:hypothetical protein